MDAPCSDCWPTGHSSAGSTQKGASSTCTPAFTMASWAANRFKKCRSGSCCNFAIATTSAGSLAGRPNRSSIFADARSPSPSPTLKDGGEGVLFAIERKPSYFLKGSGQWVEASTERIALADIVPENGEIILSMHYQSNMRVSPGYVQIERDLDLNDPIPFIRLRRPARYRA